MKDYELRGIVLQKYYDKRRQDLFQWSDEDITSFTKIDDSIKLEDVYRICDQLAEYGLISWKPIRMRGTTAGGMGKISAMGTDVIEGVSKSPIEIKIDQSHNISVHSSSNVQIGNANVQDLSTHIGKIISAIDGSNATEGEKREAKSLLKAFLEHPLVTSIAGGLASQLSNMGL
jgi:hypothetical protein